MSILTHPRVLPAIDVLDRAQAVRNAEVAFLLGADGVVFNHCDTDDGLVHRVAHELKQNWPGKIIGACYTTLGPAAALERSLRYQVDATWTAGADVTSRGASAEAREAAGILGAHGDHHFFASIPSLDHSDEPHPALAAARARELGMIPTTGCAEAASRAVNKLTTFGSAIGDAPFALAGCTAPGYLGALPVLPSYLFVETAQYGVQYFDPQLLKTCMSRLAAASVARSTRRLRQAF